MTRRPRPKLAAIIVVSAICGVLAFGVMPSTRYVIAATVLAWLASVFTVWFLEDEERIKRG
jgi:hypothetical protein